MGLKLDRINFMIVDDNAPIRSMVRQVLRAMGVQLVREAADGSDALIQMRNEIPDILVTDWVMSPMDGIELTKYIRHSKNSPNQFMPIIMATGFGERSRVFLARDAGVNEFLVKPLSASALFTRISAVIERPRQFVRVGEFFGPDRRRRKEDYAGDERRGKGPAKPAGDKPSPQAAMSQNEINQVFNP
jgi:DNA-binding response OmpR family regulator